MSKTGVNRLEEDEWVDIESDEDEQIGEEDILFKAGLGSLASGFRQRVETSSEAPSSAQTLHEAAYIPTRSLHGSDFESNAISEHSLPRYLDRRAGGQAQEIAFKRNSAREERVFSLSDASPLVIQDYWYGLLPPITREVSPISNATLCKLCNGITIEALEDNQGYAHHKSGLELLKSQSGIACCPFCALILQAVRHTFLSPDWHDEQKGLEFIRRMEQDSQQITLFAFFHHKIEIRHDSSLSWSKRYGSLEPEKRLLYLFTRHDKPNYGLTDYHLPCKDLSDTGRLLMRWIKNCLLSHDECRRSVNVLLPSRLVDVGSSEEHCFEPFLWVNPQPYSSVDGKSSTVEMERGAYTALSYCWGKGPHFITTPLTLEERKQAIPMRLLPATTRDAIIVTRLLGIRFLWVDALCILQGPSEEAQRDWAAESARMESIYSQAFLTIGAAYGHEAQSGLFMRPGSPRLPYCQLPSRWAGVDNPDPIYAGPMVGAESGWPFWLTVDEGLGINSRAWTLQEKVLSSRMANFRGDQISWECQHGQEYERGDPYERVDRSWGPRESLRVGRSYKSWNGLVEDYSSRMLTFSTDKLSALAGLAKAFWLKTEEREQYLGGVWRGSLPNSLLWSVTSPIAERGSDPDQPLPCAPTWSWASVNKKVVFNGEGIFNQRAEPKVGSIEGNVDIKVLDCQTLSEDPFSPTVKGNLVVCGSVKKAKIILPPDRGDLHYYELFDENFFATGRNELIGAALNDHSAPEKEIAAARRASPQYGWPKSLEVHCLRVRKGKGILLRHSGHKDDEYIRVGYFYLFNCSLLPEDITDDQWQDSWFDCRATKITIF